MARHVLQQAEEASDGRRTAPAALRNAAPLIAALADRLPGQGTVLEIASGTGQHAAAFAAAFPALTWQPSDVDAGQRDSITAWHRHSGVANLNTPIAIDVGAPWPVAGQSVQAVLTVNLFHLIPQSFVPLYFAQAHRALHAGGRVIIYGPFLRGTAFASDGDRSFDASLRARDPAIGYKSVQAMDEMAEKAGFDPHACDAMPANNLLLTFVKR